MRIKMIDCAAFGGQSAIGVNGNIHLENNGFTASGCDTVYEIVDPDADVSIECADVYVNNSGTYIRESKQSSKSSTRKAISNELLNIEDEWRAYFRIARLYLNQSAAKNSIIAPD